MAKIKKEVIREKPYETKIVSINGEDKIQITKADGSVEYRSL